MSRWRTWGEIPTFMKNDFTLKYYRHLSRKRTSMVFKLSLIHISEPTRPY